MQERFSAFCYICNPKQRKMSLQTSLNRIHINKKEAPVFVIGTLKIQDWVAISIKS